MHWNLREFIAEYFRLRRKRRQFLAVLMVLSLLVTGVISAWLMQPAITATAESICGLQEHVHASECYIQVLGCGLEASAEHAHSESCFYAQLICTRPEHIHVQSCFPEKLTQPTLSQVTDPAPTEAPLPAPLMAPAAATAAAASPPAPVEMPTPAASPASASAETETPTETPTPAPTTQETSPALQLSLSELQGIWAMRTGETAVWNFEVSDARYLCYTISTAGGTQITEGSLAADARSLSWTPTHSGLYRIQLTAGNEGEEKTVSAQLTVSDGELNVFVETASKSVFGGGSVDLSFGFEGGIAPVRLEVTVSQNGNTIYADTDYSGSGVSVTALTLDTASELKIEVRAIDAGGAKSATSLAVPCAVNKYETRHDWERAFDDIELTDIWADDLLTIAKTQLGYEESRINFIIDETNGRQMGYSRYGDWWGAAYSDWCAMFVSFSLHYAKIPSTYFPREAACGNWVDLLKRTDLFERSGDYIPLPGDLIFFDWQQDNICDHVGIVVQVNEDNLTKDLWVTTIEGNSGDTVAYRSYLLNDRAIVGYGELTAAWGVWLEDICPIESHTHTEACYDENLLICDLEEHTHTAECADPEPAPTLEILIPEYFCGLEEHTHTEVCYDEHTNLTCELTEHTHTDDCLVEPEIDPETILPEVFLPEYFCGLEEHAHTEICYDEHTNLTCELTEHAHTDDCLIIPIFIPEYFCGLEEHAHADACYDESGSLICELTEHAHTNDCLAEPVFIPEYFCGLEEHAHTDACYDENAILICGSKEHVHTDVCLVEPIVIPEYFCRLAEHAHTEACFDEHTNLICELTEHTHADNCLVEPVPAYFCGLDEHVHAGDCFDEHGCVVCALAEHAHTGDCLIPQHFCGLEEHVHVEACYNELGGLICGLEEHAHTEVCLVPEYYCGLAEHVHAEACCDEQGELICGLEEHTHTDACLVEVYTLWTTTAEGIDIALTGPRTSFPGPAEELQIVAALLSDTAPEAESLREVLNERGELAAKSWLFDIVLLWNGIEMQPTGPVTLKFAGLLEAEDELEAKVIHIDEAADAVTDMEGTVIEDGIVIVDTDHFSVYGVYLTQTPGTITAKLSVKTAAWDPVSKRISELKFEVSNTISNWWYVLQHTTNGGVTWTPSNPTAAGTGFKAAQNGSLIDLNATPILNSLTLNSVFRAYGYRNNTNKGYTADLNIYHVLEFIKPGFIDWLTIPNNGYYPELPNPPALPANITELYNAFGVYYNQKTVTLTKSVTVSPQHADLTAAVVNPDPLAAYYYQWFYEDASGAWQLLNSITMTATIDVLTEPARTLLAGGKNVHAKVYTELGGGLYKLEGISNVLLVDPVQDLYGAVYPLIDAGLAGLGFGSAFSLTDGLEFHGRFYYGNAARDSRVPFSDAGSYRNYLAELYLTSGFGAVQLAWYHYLYDLYDPSYNEGNFGDSFSPYPNDLDPNDNINFYGTYGDKHFYWPKDANAINSSPFHAAVFPVVNPLDYSFLDGGVDYSNFVSDVSKTAKAVAAGDFNSERRYDIEIVADSQAKVRAPVALIFQIQTSWQMFDLDHANRLLTDPPLNGFTKVGAASWNTSLANLYDIKQALLRLVDYVDANIPGNNLVVGITDVEHAGTYNMFNGTGLYVTNDLNIARAGIQGWDTFGNCEHVHYESKALQLAVSNLEANLAHWKDVYGAPVPYSNIQKSVVIIGGPVENSTGTNGLGVELPWRTFSTAGFNSVYGIRTNEGWPSAANSLGIISWIDYSKNNTGTKFKDGVGTAFTDKYIASSEDAVFNALKDIVLRELNAKSINVGGGDTFVEDVTITDTVSEEFFLNKTADITAAILNADGSVKSSKVLTLAGAGVAFDPITGEVITTTVDGLIIRECPDGTTTLEYNFGQVNNSQKAVLNFQVEARESYIGSNTVLANVGTPDVDYKHTRATGMVDEYARSAYDTPQVNVPIRFSTVDGLTADIVVGGFVNLKDLSEAIVQDAQDRVDNYPQTNGTLSYIWVLPNGAEVPAGSVEVNNGSIGSASFPDRSYPYAGTTPGNYTGMLKVTFTPRLVDPNNPNFSDAATKTAVIPRTEHGHVWINVYAADSKRDLIVRKKWVGGVGSPITFQLLANGQPFSSTAYPGPAFTLNPPNWEMRFDDLPVVIDGVVQHYSVTEDPVPAGYAAAYHESALTEDAFGAKITLRFTSSADINAGKLLTFTFTYGTKTDYTYQMTAPIKYLKNTPYEIMLPGYYPLDGSGNVLTPCTVTAVLMDGTNRLIAGSGASTAVKQVSGTIEVPMWTITNRSAVALPNTGGRGTLPYVIGGSLLMAITFLGGCSQRRKKKRRCEL